MKINNIVIKGGGSAAVDTTWAELKSMRDNSQLTVGCLYRITDYETIISGVDVQSAGHVFDIVVLATDVNMLSEDAMAVHSERDTEGYFANSKLEAWELKYCLDNDTSRFAWASVEGEQWIISVFETTVYMSLVSTDDHTYDGFPYKFTASVEGLFVEFYFAHLELQEGEEFIPNKMVINGEIQENAPITQIIHNNTPEGKGVIWYMNDEFNNLCYYDFKNVLFKRSLIIATKENPSENECAFYGKYAGQTMMEQPLLPEGYAIDPNDSKYLYTFSVIVADGSVKDNSIGLDLTSEGMGIIHSCNLNQIKANEDEYSFILNLNDIVFVSTYNSIEDMQNIVQIGNTFGTLCSYNTFVNKAMENIFGSYCYGNSFGNYCEHNSFGNDCSLNTFNNNCSLNSFGNGCQYNLLGELCFYNSFGNNSTGNLLGYGCANNSFGKQCNGNSFGNNCEHNSFGNGCKYNDIFDSAEYITVFEGVQYVSIDILSVLNAQVLNGTSGSDPSNKLHINFVAGKSYTQVAGLDSQGNLKIWNPADLVQ